MASVGFKPGQRFNVSDWHDSNNFINSNAERSRVASHHIRQEARSLDLSKFLNFIGCNVLH